MTVSATQARQIYACNGATTVRSVPFKIEDETHLSVVRKTISDGTLLTLTLNSGGANGYTVQNVGSANAQFTTVTAWSNLYQLMVKRAVPLSQANDYVDNDSFPAATLEQTVDLIVEQLQSLTDRADRALYADDFTPLNTYTFTFPIPIDGGTIVWDSGSAKWVSTTSSLATLQAQAALLAGIASDITAVAGISANVTTVAGDTTNINTVAGSISNVNTVAGNMANLATLIANFTNINTVAGISANVTSVAAVAAAVANLGSLTTEISNLNTIRANITTVAGVATSVSTVAGISTAVSTVAGIAAAVSGVNTVAANVTTVAGVAANVTTVAGVAANVTTVAGIAANVTTVAGAAANIATIVANLTTITNAANNIPKANLSATTDPGVGNDSSQGYQAGSEWVNTTGGKVWFCTSAAVGAANWVNATATSGTFAGLSDVALSGLADLDFIQYTSGTTKYRNRSVANVKTDLSLNNVTNVAQMPLTYLDTDTALAANSDSKVASQKAIKTYVDAIVAGLDMKPAARVVATTNQAGTYLNGSSGVGATLTYTATGADVIDGVTLALNDYALLTGQTTTFQNGLYKVTLAGTGGVAGVLTRAVEYDTSSEIFEGTYVVIEEGTSKAGTLWILTTSGAITVGSTGLTFTQLAVSSLAASALTGNTLASSVVTSSLTAVGTLTTGATGTGFTLAFGSSTMTGQVPYANGGTGASSFTNHGVVTAGASALTTVAPGTSGNVLTSNGTDWTSAAAASGGATLALSTGTAAINLDATYNGKSVELTGSTSRTFTFTAAATLGAAWACIIANNSTAELTLDPNASETIDGLTTFKMYQGEKRLVMCNATGFISFVLKPFYLTVAQAASPFTFTKPPGYLSFRVRCGGAGGSGGNGSTQTGKGGGGGGGACVEVHLAASKFSATETVTVGAGGTGVTGSNLAGNVGNNTTVTAGSITVTAYGGGPGSAGGGSNTATNGGGGGGTTSAGLAAGTGGGTLGGAVGSSSAGAASTFGGGGGGNAGIGGASIYGGGGGGSGEGGATACDTGGTSLYGGGGGSGGSSTGTQTAGGVSQFGGNGGAGGNGSNNGGAGTAGTDGYGGGGGGGTSANANTSGAGGNGSAAIWGIA